MTSAECVPLQDEVPTMRAIDCILYDWLSASTLPGPVSCLWLRIRFYFFLCIVYILAGSRERSGLVVAGSLGILVFGMLVGGPPFYHENVQIMYRMIEEEDLPMPEKYLPPTGRDLLSKLLNRNPAQHRMSKSSSLCVCYCL